ncbi:hypothetical protein ACFC96_41280 [Streptomyces sp. NPDC055955]
MKNPANREPAAQFTDAVAELGRLTSESPARREAIHQAAIARARRR